MVKLSIITVNLNNAEGLAKTVESVRKQTFGDYEFIVVDGGSTDASLEVIKQNTDIITHWLSETDSGIYNAMNKGVKLANGEYCQFLNSGDELIAEDTLSTVFALSGEVDIAYGNDIAVEPDGSKRKREFASELTFLTIFRYILPHQSSFIKRELFYKFGFYNENHRIVSDWEFFINTIILHNVSYKHLGVEVCYFDEAGIGSSPEYADLRNKEKKDVFNYIAPRLFVDYFDAYRDQQELKELINGKYGIIVRPLLKLKHWINRKKHD